MFNLIFLILIALSEASPQIMIESISKCQRDKIGNISKITEKA